MTDLPGHFSAARDKRWSQSLSTLLLTQPQARSQSFPASSSDYLQYAKMEGENLGSLVMCMYGGVT